MYGEYMTLKISRILSELSSSDDLIKSVKNLLKILKSYRTSHNNYTSYYLQSCVAWDKHFHRFIFIFPTPSNPPMTIKVTDAKLS